MVTEVTKMAGKYDSKNAKEEPLNIMIAPFDFSYI